MIVNTGEYLNRNETRELRAFWRERGLLQFHSMNAATNMNMYSEKRGFLYRYNPHDQKLNVEIRCSDNNNGCEPIARMFMEHEPSMFARSGVR